MTDSEHTSPAPGSRVVPVVTPTNRFNITLPFSKITIEQPRQEIAELAAVVAELAAAVEGLMTGSDLAQLRIRAEAVAARLR